MGFDSKCSFYSPTILLELLLCFWMWISFFGGIQHSPVDGYSAASCNFGVLTGEDKRMSYSARVEREGSEETRIERGTCTPMFITAQFTVARIWRQP